MPNSFRFAPTTATTQSGDELSFRVEGVARLAACLGRPVEVRFFSSEDPAEAGFEIAHYQIELESAGGTPRFKEVKAPRLPTYPHPLVRTPEWEEDLLIDAYGIPRTPPGWVAPKALFRVPHIRLRFHGAARAPDVLRIVKVVVPGLPPKSARRGGEKADDSGYYFYLSFEITLPTGEKIGSAIPTSPNFVRISYWNELAHNANETLRVEMEGHRSRIAAYPSAVRNGPHKEREVIGVAYGSLFGAALPVIASAANPRNARDEVQRLGAYNRLGALLRGDSSQWDLADVQSLPILRDLHGVTARSCSGWLLQALGVAHLKCGVPRLFIEGGQRAYISGAHGISPGSGVGLIMGLQQSNGWTCVFVNFAASTLPDASLQAMRRDGNWRGTALSISAVFDYRDADFVGKRAFLDGLNGGIAMWLSGQHCGFIQGGRVWEVHYHYGNWEAGLFDNRKSVSDWIEGGSFDAEQSFGLVALPPGLSLPPRPGTTP